MLGAVRQRTRPNERASWRRVIRRPDPPLDFDEMLEVVRAVYVGRRVSVNLFAPP
jgi:hypothetical protein